MKRYPSIPPVADAPDDLLTGHLWLLELIDGWHLRFRMDESGLLRFGDRDADYDDPESLPAAYRHAVRHVRERFDRESLRAAVDDVTDVVFFGVATHRRTVGYDWERLPSFLGHDVWSTATESFRPPDAAKAIFERLGLTPVNAIERERRARDFDPATYAVPSSAWYDGPAAGVVVRNKAGGRGVIRASDVPADSLEEERSAGSAVTRPNRHDHVGSTPDGVSPAALAATHATRRRLERIAARMTDRGTPVTAEELTRRAFEELLRERHGELPRADSALEAVRSELAAEVRSFLDEASQR